MTRKGLLAEVVDAVASHQQVDWNGCAARATGELRRRIANLRVVATAFAPPADGRPEPVPSARRESSGGRRALGWLLAVALCECVASLAVLPWIWDSYHRLHGFGATYLAVILVGYAGCAAPLLFSRRRDPRAWLLGVYFALMASIPAGSILPFFIWGASPDGEVAYTIYVHPFVLRCAVLWQFTREFPRVHRLTPIDRVARRMVPATALVGVAAAVAFVPLRALAQRGVVAPVVPNGYADAVFALLTALETAAIVALCLRARGASPDEFARIVLFGGSFLIWSAGSAVYDAIEAFRPGFFLVNMVPTPTVIVLGVMRAVCIATMIYAVIARQALDVRTVVRKSYRRLLARRTLAAVAAAPAVAVGWRIANQPEQTVGAVLADPWVGVLGGTATVGLAAIVGHRRLIGRLDAWVYPESLAQGRVLARAGAALALAQRAKDVGDVVARTVRAACGAPASLLVAAGADAYAHSFVGTAPEIPPLVRTSVIAEVAHTARESMPVDPDDAASVYGLLPPGDAQWVAETRTAVVVPVAGTGVSTIGIVAVGRCVDDRLPTAFDVMLIELLAASAGLALQRMETQAASADESPAASECPACGLLGPPDASAPCACGAVTRVAPVPCRLADTYRLERRLGAGGMGTAYLGRDDVLDRPVAVKTVTVSSPDLLARLTQEARAMAAIQDPAIAQIHGLETWRGRPFLVIEFLVGGTLADRLREGPIPVPEAVAIAIRVAGGLEALHDAGYLHRDVKPSNIGFTANGAAKLFDTGLACLRDAGDQAVAGTVRYLSPEVLRGDQPGEADDVWALGVVLYEMVAGKHPFAGGGGEGLVARIRRQQIPPPGGGRAAAFSAAFLTAGPTERIGQARAFADALRLL